MPAWSAAEMAGSVMFKIVRSRFTAVVELPELDGARIAILGLHHGERGAILHLLASGVTLEGDWKYARGVRPLPVL